MTILSVLRSTNCIRRLPLHLQQQRSGGHANVLPIYPSRFQWFKFKDLLHFYVLLGVIPLTLLVAASNIFVGRAELADTPEGFVPAYWEYERHPITRFLARYCTQDPIRDHELRVGQVSRNHDRYLILTATDQVHRVMNKNNDYRAWYFYLFDQAGSARYNRVRNEAVRHNVAIPPE